MEDIIKKLLRVNIEIEGMIRVMASADCDPLKWQTAKEMILERASELTKLLNEAPISEQGPAQPASVDEDFASETINKETAYEETTTTSDEEIIINVSEEDSAAQDIKKKFVPNEVAEKIQIIDEAEDALPKHSEASTDAIDEDDSTRIQEKQNTTHIETSTAHEEEHPTTLSDVLNPKDTRLEDLLAKKEKKSLASAFTINDKFRFIRGIFCDDHQDFDYTVDRLSECDSLAEVYDYLLNDQGWDIDNEEVKDFIGIIANYFNG